MTKKWSRKKKKDTNARYNKQMLDLKKIQESLRESEEKYRAIFEGAGAGILGAEVLTRRFVFANSRMSELTGYATQELLKLSVNDIHPKKYLPEAIDQLKKLSNNKISIDRDVPILRKDKGIIYCDINASSIMLGGQKVLVGLFTDNTQSKKMEEAVHDTENTLKEIIQGSPIPQFIIDRYHKVIAWNKALEEYSGIKAERVLNTRDHWKAFYSKRRPCMADLLLEGSVQNLRKWYGDNHSKSKFVRGAYEATAFFPKMKEGGIWLHFTAIALKDKKGKPTCALETLQDITERKKAEEALQISEEKFRVIFEGAADGILVADAKTGNFVFANPRICEITGYLKHELLKLSPNDIHPKKELPYILEQFQKQLQGKIIIAKDVQVLKKDGTIIYCDVSSKPIKIKNRELLLGFFRDISERKKAEEQLIKLNKELGSKVEELEKFSKLTVGRELKMIELKKRIAEQEEGPRKK
ncbi:MAG: PAS domain S-box protein [Candidatus Woesearchaeota archaeon]